MMEASRKPGRSSTRVQRVLLVLGLGLGLGFGQTLSAAVARADVVYLKDLQANALQRRSELSAATARMERSAATVDRARSAYMPSISAGANASLAPGRTLARVTDNDTNEVVVVSGSNPLGESGAWTPQPRIGVSLGVRGNLYDFGRTAAVVEAAEAQRRAVESDAKAREAMLEREVSGAYLGWATAHALQQLAQDTARSAEEREQRIVGLAQEGARPQIDRTAAAQETLVARIEAVSAAQAVEAARMDLAHVSATELPQDATPDPALLAGDASVIAFTHQAEAAAIALDRAQSAADAQARAQDHGNSASIAFSGEAGLQSQTDNLFPVYSVGVGLSVPLWDGGGSDAAVVEARAQARELAAQAQGERARAKHRQARARAAQRHAAERLSLATAAVTLADVQVKQLTEAGGYDSTSFHALVLAETARLRAERERIMAQAQLAQASLELAP